MNEISIRTSHDGQSFRIAIDDEWRIGACLPPLMCLFFALLSEKHKHDTPIFHYLESTHKVKKETSYWKFYNHAKNN